MTFHELHRATGAPLVLPNAWDLSSALAFVEAGFDAVGTTSFGVASALGLPDGQRVTKQANLALTATLAGLPVPVSVDIEDGYHDDPGAVADYVAELAAAGAAGINIEDSTSEALVPAADHAAKVGAIKQRTPELFVNARVDTYWLGEDATPAETLARAGRYVDAGADGIFVPGATEPELLRTLARELPVPVNVLVHPALTVRAVGELGIRRVSTGSLPYRAALHAAVAAAAAVRDGLQVPPATPYGELQGRLVAQARSTGKA